MRGLNVEDDWGCCRGWVDQTASEFFVQQLLINPEGRLGMRAECIQRAKTAGIQNILCRRSNSQS